MKDADLPQNIMELLLQCLQEVPSVTKLHDTPDKTDSRADLVIEAVTGRETFRLIVGISSNGQPRYARETVALLSMQLSHSPENTYPVFAAPFISKSAAEICREAGAGTIDLAGNCRLAFDGIYIERQGRPNRFVSKRSLKSLYETRSSRVLRALLFDPNLKWKLTDLSEAAGVSIGQVFNVKKALVDREWAVFDKHGLKLTQPVQILRDWGKNYSLYKNTLFHFHSSETPAVLESRLAGVFSKKRWRYALTSLSAYRYLASIGESAGVYAYVDGNAEQTADFLHLARADSESNVTLMLPHDEGVFFGMQEMEGLNVASPIQTFLDLVGMEEKGEEAAETLFLQVIEKAWQSTLNER